MSTASKVCFGLSCVVSLSIAGGVLLKQDRDRDRLHAGVVKDIERQQRRKMENIVLLNKQAELTKELRAYAATTEPQEDR